MTQPRCQQVSVADTPYWKYITEDLDMDFLHNAHINGSKLSTEISSGTSFVLAGFKGGNFSKYEVKSERRGELRAFSEKVLEVIQEKRFSEQMDAQHFDYHSDFLEKYIYQRSMAES